MDRIGTENKRKVQERKGRKAKLRKNKGGAVKDSEEEEIWGNKEIRRGGEGKGMGEGTKENLSDAKEGERKRDG